MRVIICEDHALVRDAVPAWPNVHHVDVFPLMLNNDGSPRHELFTEDCLHMSRAGYELWTSQVRACFAKTGLLG